MCASLPSSRSCCSAWRREASSRVSSSVCRASRAWRSFSSCSARWAGSRVREPLGTCAFCRPAGTPHSERGRVAGTAQHRARRSGAASLSGVAGEACHRSAHGIAGARHRRSPRSRHRAGSAAAIRARAGCACGCTRRKFVWSMGPRREPEASGRAAGRWWLWYADCAAHRADPAVECGYVPPLGQLWVRLARTQ